MDDFRWQIDRFADIKILRFQIPGWDALPIKYKVLLYYLGQAALCGRDIIFDQNYEHNLAIRRIAEAIYRGYAGSRTAFEWANFEIYLKRVWFSNGIHHHYSNDKIIPSFGPAYFLQLLEGTPAELLPSELGGVKSIVKTYSPIIFDPTVAPKRVNQAQGLDMVAQSASNFYRGLTQKEVEDYYTSLIDPMDATPTSQGLNTQLVKEKGAVAERVWMVGGMYGAALERIIFWLEKAEGVALNPNQAGAIRTLINYYKSGNLKLFDQYNILWLNDMESRVDFVNGFIETYGDPLGYKGTWESLVNFRNDEATLSAQLISSNAQWFEDNSPIDEQFKKSEVKGVTAKVINATTLGGDCYPTPPLGINLPNSDWIRKLHGSKSVTIENISYAHYRSALGNGFIEEFAWNEAEIERHSKYGFLAGNLHTNLHECLGHGSGQLAPGVRGDELHNYGAVLEETRADLFALYFIMDPRMVELGVMPTLEVAITEYDAYIRNGLMTQLTRIELGKDIEQAHMRNRQLIASWCYEKGKDANVIEKRTRNGKTFFVITSYSNLRVLFGTLLRKVQRIKSVGDFEAGRELVEKYGVRINPLLHKEILDRFAALELAPYAGFVNPHLVPVWKDGSIQNIGVEYPTDYTQQMLHYSSQYSFLPTYN